MTNTFRDALLKALEKSEIPLRQVAEGSGVSYEQLKRLKNRPNASTNVEDAVKVATFFGLPLNDFLGRPELANPIQIVSVYTQLSDQSRARLEAFAEGLLAAEDPSRHEEN